MKFAAAHLLYNISFFVVGFFDSARNKIPLGRRRVLDKLFSFLRTFAYEHKSGKQKPEPQRQQPPKPEVYENKNRDRRTEDGKNTKRNPQNLIHIYIIH